MKLKIFLLLLLLLQLDVALASARLSLFVPRTSPFWERMGDFASAASKALDINLQIYNAHNDPDKMLEQVKQAAADGSDGFLFMNYAGIGESILQIAEQQKIPALLINSALDDPSLLPRVHYRYWIGSITPDDRQAGIRLATRLIDLARSRGASQFNILAYIGVAESRAHSRRFEGLKSVFEARSDTTLVQAIANTADTQQADSDFRSAFKQHPQINIVWSYSDKFAVSAAQAYASMGIEQPVVFGGIDWQKDALQSLAQGVIDFDLGGHIFDAAQGVIMLSDYLQGRDFADEKQQWSSSMLIASRQNVAQIQHILEDPASIDYRALSKSHNPNLLQYRFSLDSVPTRSKVQLDLTAEQQQWLEAHPKISVGVMDGWPPFDFVDENGVARGIGADIVHELNRRLDYRLQLVSGEWKEIYQATEQKRLDMIMDITPKPSRQADFNFTRLYLDVPHVLIARKDVAYLRSEKDLAGKTLALEEGFGNVQYFSENYPAVTLKLYPNTEKALEAVSRGDADAYAGNRVVALYLIEKLSLANLRVHGRLLKSGSRLAIGTRKDYVLLRDILQKALDDIGQQRLREIRNRWIYARQNEPAAASARQFQNLPKLNLNRAEKDWLLAHDTISLGIDPGWEPLEYIDENGDYQGLSSAYMNYFSRLTGLHFNPPQNIAWSKMLKKLQRKEIDVAPMISMTEARKAYLNFTEPYITLPLVIFNRRGETLLGGLADLEGKKIAVIKGYSVNNFLQRDYPKIERIPVASVTEGLDALSTSKVDAYVDVLAVGGYQVAAGGYTNLQVASSTPYSLDFSIGVRKDWPILVAIFNKALGQITEQQKNEFLRQWLTVRYAQKTDFTFALWVLGVSLIIILLFILRAREMSRINKKLALANAEVEKSSRFKSQFLANMSHEIRTPMNAIVGLGHLLSRTELTLKQADYIRKLQKSAQSLLGLIDDILDVSRIEAGQLKIEHIEFNLEQLLNELAELAQVRLGDKDIEFIYDLDNDVPTVMLGDPFRLNQILTNLVSNAIKFTDSGNITLKVCVMERNDDSVKLKFNVTDNGIGIEAEKLNTLFEPFIQEDGSTTRRYGGSGLGLSISRQLTQLMHGEMGVESIKGVGSTFHFTLPFELPDITGNNTLLSLPEPDLRGLNVLLVDDNKQTLEILSHMLQSMTFNVVCASSGEQALSLISQQQKDFDLILLDWRMPELDGADTAIQIRKMKSAAKLPIIIMMTAYGREASEQNIFEHTDVDGFLVKPITPSQLFNAIMLAYRSIHQKNTAAEMPRSEPIEALSGTVLLAEDNQINQQVASEILQQMGLDVHICENGIEAVSSLPAIQPDVILMDIQMPFMDGYQATREIRSMPQYVKLPIIAMTANAMNEDIEKSLQCGMNEHISKPVDPQLLYNTLKQYLPSARDSENKTGTQTRQLASDKKWPREMPGLDIRQGIKQVGGNEQLYQKLLNDFLANYQDLVQTLQQHLQQGEIDKADRLMHTIKGVSASIGANRLMQITTEINNQIHHEQQVQAGSLQKLATACDELFGSLRQLTQQFQATDDASQQSIDDDQIVQIKELLQHSDARAYKLLQQYHDALAEQIGEQNVQQIIRLTREYEFEQALQQFEAALQESRNNARD